MSKYQEALEYLATADEMSIVQIFLGTCSEGSFWSPVGTCVKEYSISYCIEFLVFGHLKAEA